MKSFINKSLYFCSFIFKCKRIYPLAESHPNQHEKIRHRKFIKSHSLYVQLVDLVVTTFESSFWYSTFVAVAMMHQNLASHLDNLMHCSLLVKEDTNYHIACDMEKRLLQNHLRSFPSDISASCGKATSWALDCGTIMEG